MQIILSSRIVKKQATNWIWPSSLYQRFPSCPDLTGISVHHKALGRRLSIRDIHSSKAQKPSRPLIRLSTSEGGPGQATYPPQISVFSTYKMWTRPPLSQGCCTGPASTICYSTLSSTCSVPGSIQPLGVHRSTWWPGHHSWILFGCAFGGHFCENSAPSALKPLFQHCFCGQNEFDPMS